MGDTSLMGAAVGGGGGSMYHEWTRLPSYVVLRRQDMKVA